MTYTELKDRAKELNVEFKGQIAKEELEALVASAEEELEMQSKAEGYEKPIPTVAETAKKKVNARQAAMLMRKVKITPLEERMRGLPSEFYSVGNGSIGFVKKVVRFNVPTWEPQVLLDMLAEKTMLIQEETTVNGKEVTIVRSAEAYSIVDVPLTAEEKAELAASKK